MKSKAAPYALGAVLLVVFAGFSYSKFTDALTPYVPYEQAIASPRTVQVAGGLVAGSSAYDDRAGYLRFSLVDPENSAKTLAVRYEGVKPANFEDAISIVAIGRWDPQAEEFAAQDLLVKCPSKYQGLDEYETKTYGAEGYDTKSYGSEGYEAKPYSSEGSYGSQGYGTGSQEG
ncbi:MAG: cytochrome c maturation protein CcmE [Holophagales bacterium]|nr:cytochrome c maturation protein CcmE [Holophagales bacterium]